MNTTIDPHILKMGVSDTQKRLKTCQKCLILINMQIHRREIRIYTTPNGRAPYRQWYARIKDEKLRTIISTRLTRLETGNLGDFKRLNQDLYELRIHYGPGYRIYFGSFQNTVVVLLCAGTKGTQRRDITRAQNYWNDFIRQTKEQSQ